MAGHKKAVRTINTNGFLITYDPLPEFLFQVKIIF